MCPDPVRGPQGLKETPLTPDPWVVSPADRTCPQSRAAAPAVAVCVVLDEGQEGLVPALLEDLAGQVDVDAEMVLIDLTLAARIEVPEGARATVVRGTPGSRGAAYLLALDATRAPYLAWQLPSARCEPQRLARLIHALESDEGADLAVSDLLVCSEDGDSRCDLDLQAPPSCWETTALIRREALARIDPASFAPAERALFEALLCDGRVAHVHEPLGLVPQALFDERRARTVQDAQLVALAAAPHEGPPEVTVLLATHERCDVLLECVEAFARQLVPPGFLEIIVIDDGSDDQTPEVGSSLAPRVPFTFLRQLPADGASRARILGLPHARGRLIFFANDDTIPQPDCVRRHVEAHAAYAPRRVSVLGTFEQPSEYVENSLMALLEEAPFVFGYPNLEDGQELDASYFYTCHISVPLQAVHDAGGFDPDFSHYGCEDTDLGMRLEQAGIPIVYRSECRATHRHFFTFDDLRRRQRVVARAHVRLFTKHPELLEQSPWWSALTRAELVRRNEPVMPHLRAIEAACRTLAGINLRRLGGAAGAGDPTVERVGALLAELFQKLNTVWWDQGFLEGFEAHSLCGFPELLAGDAIEEPVARPRRPEVVR